MSSSPTPVITQDDAYLFNEGSHSRLYLKLGAHVLPEGGVSFAVWAPSATRVTVFGDFNGWDKGSHPLQESGSSGIWEGTVPEAEHGQRYKFHIVNEQSNHSVDKADPFGFFAEQAPSTASIIWDLDYEWSDGDWMNSRGDRNSLEAPVSVYEVHIGSWMRVADDNWRSLNYRELAPKLAEYVSERGFTHVEFLPVMEHPFFGSWGYQTSGYFAPSSMYGSPQDFMYLVDTLHQHGIGVILDWVPSHFPTDEHGLAYFDGTHLFEHADPRQGFHPDWNSYIFNYGRHEVRSFLLSSALYWFDKYHIDGLRVDAVASMLYLDYSRKEGEWIPNRYGGRENIEAIDFLRQLNETVYENYPDTMTTAEESTAWPMVSRPTYLGGLGFGLKWDMGWMHDTLQYMSHEPVHRKFHHNEITFRMIYAFNENFILPLSHDEVVHGKGSLLNKMPGDDWQQFANLRLLLAYMWAQPGKKLMFMGGEFGQRNEWNHDGQLQWELTDQSEHSGLQSLISDLNNRYRDEAALHELDCDAAGYEWIDGSDSQQSTLAFVRRGKDGSNPVLAVFNFTPIPRHGFRVGVPEPGRWEEIVNTDSEQYGGSGQGNYGGADSKPVPMHGKYHSLTITLPPLGAVFFRHGD